MNEMVVLLVERERLSIFFRSKNDAEAECLSDSTMVYRGYITVVIYRGYILMRITLLGLEMSLRPN